MAHAELRAPNCARRNGAPELRAARRTNRRQLNARLLGARAAGVLPWASFEEVSRVHPNALHCVGYMVCLQSVTHAQTAAFDEYVEGLFARLETLRDARDVLALMSKTSTPEWKACQRWALDWLMEPCNFHAVEQALARFDASMCHSTRFTVLVHVFQVVAFLASPQAKVGSANVMDYRCDRDRYRFKFVHDDRTPGSNTWQPDHSFSTVTFKQLRLIRAQLRRDVPGAEEVLATRLPAHSPGLERGEGGLSSSDLDEDDEYHAMLDPVAVCVWEIVALARRPNPHKAAVLAALKLIGAHALVEQICVPPSDEEERRNRLGWKAFSASGVALAMDEKVSIMSRSIDESAFDDSKWFA